MRLNHIKVLVEADLLQANRQTNTNERSQRMQKKNIYWRVLLQNGAIILLFSFLFGTLIFNLPLAEFPGVFSETIGLMILFSVLQVYQLIYSLFYDDVNLSTYLSLPFSLSELFLSKIATVLFTTFAYFITPLILISILGMQTGHPWFLAIPIGLFSTLLIMLGTFLSVFLILHLLHQWSFFRKRKNIFMIVIYVIFFGFLFINLYQNEPAETIPGAGIIDSEINPFFVGFHEIFISGTRLSGWLKVGAWLIAVVISSYIAFKWVIPQLYFEDEQPKVQKKVANKKRSDKLLSSNSKWQIFSKYQLRQLSDTTLILQMLFSKFYLPFIMVAPLFFSEDTIDLTILETVPHLWGSYLIIGAAIGYIMITESSISGIIISFDKENFHYIKSLPLSFQGYLKLKFYFAFLIEWILGALAILAVMWYLSLGFVPILVLLIGYTTTTYASSLYYYMRDYRLLNLTWNNFTELMQRGVSQAVRIFSQIFIIIIGSLLIAGLLFWFIIGIQDTTRLIISIGISVLLLSITFGFYKYAAIKFWPQFNK